MTSSQEDFRKTWEDKHPRRIESKAYPRVSSNMASWEIRELNGHFNGKIIKSSNFNGIFQQAMFDYCTRGYANFVFRFSCSPTCPTTELTYRGRPRFPTFLSNCISGFIPCGPHGWAVHIDATMPQVWPSLQRLQRKT